MKRLLKKAISGYGLTYLLCEDWFIYAYDNKGNVYSVNTELWPEWDDVSDEEQIKEGAVEKYMLPIAKKRWDRLSWYNTGYTLWTMWGDEATTKEMLQKHDIRL